METVVWLPRLVAPACGSELCDAVLISVLALVVGLSCLQRAEEREPCDSVLHVTWWDGKKSRKA